MEVMLRHHIYTTVGGYKSVYVSEGISSELLTLLERYSALTYPKVGGLPIFAISPVERGLLVFSKAFRGGVDHVGRPKACVHNIVVPAVIPPKNGNHLIPPLIEDSFFLSEPPEPHDIPYLSSRLKGEAPSSGLAEAVRRVIRSGEFRDPINKALLLATTASQEFFVTGGFLALRRRIGTILPLVPRASRIRLSLSSEEAPISAVFGNRGTHLRCVKDTSSAPPEAPLIMLDGNGSYNMPAMNRFCAYIDESGDPDDVLRLIMLIEHYAPDEPLTFDLYPILIEAFESVKSAVSVDGKPELTPETVRPLMLSLRHFVSCGFEKFVLDVLVEVGRFLSRRFDDDSVLANIPQVQHNLTNPDVPLSSRINQIEILVNWVLNSIKY